MLGSRCVGQVGRVSVRSDLDVWNVLGAVFRMFRCAEQQHGHGGRIVYCIYLRRLSSAVVHVDCSFKILLCEA